MTLLTYNSGRGMGAIVPDVPEPFPEPENESKGGEENMRNYEEDEEEKTTKQTKPSKEEKPKSLKQRIPIIRGIPTYVLYLIVGIAVVLFLVLTLASLVSVPAGYKGVITSAPDESSIGQTLDEGWHFNPGYLLDTIEMVRYQEQTVSYVGDDGANDNQGSIGVRSSDSLEVYMDISVTYHIPAADVGTLRTHNGDYIETLLDPISRSIPRDIASQYTALDMIGADRGTVEHAISENITTKLAQYNIIVDQFSLRDIRVPATVSSAIEAKKVAEQNLITAGFQANTTIRLAQGNMSAMIIQAQGQAQAKVLNANGSAEAIKVVMDQFAKLNPNGTNQTQMYLEWTYIQALSDPNSRIQYVILPSSNGTPILLNVGK